MENLLTKNIHGENVHVFYTNDDQVLVFNIKDKKYRWIPTDIISINEIDNLSSLKLLLEPIESFTIENAKIMGDFHADIAHWSSLLSYESITNTSEKDLRWLNDFRWISLDFLLKSDINELIRHLDEEFIKDILAIKIILYLFGILPLEVKRNEDGNIIINK